jgi:hypothetical protein
MKLIPTVAAVAALGVLSGCVVTVVENHQMVQQPPTQPIVVHPVIRPAPVVFDVPHCGWVSIPVYGVVDLHRTHNRTVRIQETAYVERQWVCD